MELEHPVEVADLVVRAGASPEVVAAAVLHDLIEDTGIEIGLISSEFGPGVAALVSALTEDPSIEPYEERKAEARGRACASGADAALIFVADKLSNARRMHRGQKERDTAKIEHYRATLALMRDAYPELPLLDELEAELRAIARSMSSA